MIKFSFAMLLSFNLFASFSQNGSVCLIVDARETDHERYPNHARLESNPSSYRVVRHLSESCFDLNEAYFMQSFSREDQGTITYSTICYYQPNAKDAGKVLRFVPEGQSWRCLIEDPFTIDQALTAQILK